MLEMQCQSNELDYLPKSIDKMEKLETLKVIFLTILQIKISWKHENIFFEIRQVFPLFYFF